MLPSPENFFCKLLAPESIENQIEQLRNKGHTIATLNGSFDLLHAGHLEILHQGSLQADIFIVALNSDCSIQAYKSPKRPIIPLHDRLKMMASLQMVDFVTWFDETDPRLLLEKIRPDVHVNGAEYGPNCIEAEVVKRHGGKLHMVSLVPGLSTSHIIATILQRDQDICVASAP